MPRRCATQKRDYLGETTTGKKSERRAVQCGGGSTEADRVGRALPSEGGGGAI